MHDKTVLLVEDNPDDEELAMRAFKKNRLSNNIQVARDGAEALDYFFGPNKDSNPTPLLILLDLKLPKIDGLEVLKRLREDDKTKHIPIVILTSSDEEEDIVKSYCLGCNSYIRKPVDFRQFVDAVKQVELYWLVINVAPPERVEV